MSSKRINHGKASMQIATRNYKVCFREQRPCVSDGWLSLDFMVGFVCFFRLAWIDLRTSFETRFDGKFVYTTTVSKTVIFNFLELFDKSLELLIYKDIFALDP